MNQELRCQTELLRPATSNPAVVVSPAPIEVARAIPATRVAVARPAAVATLTPMSILRALQRRQLLALGVAIVAAAIGGPAAWYLVPAKYKVQARLLVAAQPPKVLYRTLESETHSGDDYKRFQTTQLTLVKSRVLLNAAVGDKKLGNSQMLSQQLDPISWLQEKLAVEFVSGSE